MVYKPIGWSLDWVENSIDVFMCCTILCFYFSFHTRLLLIILPGTNMVYVSNLVHTTMLEYHCQIRVIVFVGMHVVILSLVLGLIVYSTHVIPYSLYVICFCLGFHIK